MKLEEISSLYYINKEIKLLQQELYDITNDRNFYGVNILSDMPKGGKKKDKLLEYVEKKQTIEEMINYNLKKLQKKRAEIEDFISNMEDPELRLILRLRCINNMNWTDIGFEVGMDRRTASRKFSNYFKGCPQCP